MVFVLSIQIVYGNVIINEVMYNPSTGMGGTDADLEWVELYNNDSNTINLTDWLV